MVGGRADCRRRRSDSPYLSMRWSNNPDKGGLASKQSWKNSKRSHLVRNMDVTPDGNIALACSGVNRIGLVHIQ
jgi:hypothetical protein